MAPIAFVYPLLASSWGETLLRFVLGVHVCTDAAHVLCVLLPEFMARCLGEARATRLADMYVSLFQFSAPSASSQELALLRRALAYWATAMSIARAVAALVPNSQCALCAAACMYLLEALGFEFEAATSGTVRVQAARTISVVSVAIALLALFLAVR
jgi:hypothetical protein